MSLWQFLASVEGYAEAHAPKDEKTVPPLSEAEAADLDQLLTHSD